MNPNHVNLTRAAYFLLSSLLILGVPVSLFTKCPLNEDEVDSPAPSLLSESGLGIGKSVSLNFLGVPVSLFTKCPLNNEDEVDFPAPLSLLSESGLGVGKSVSLSSLSLEKTSSMLGLLAASLESIESSNDFNLSDSILILKLSPFRIATYG